MKKITLSTLSLLLTHLLFAQRPDTLWTKTYGGTSSDWGNSVQETSDGGFIIGGITSSFGAGGADVYLIKTDANGDTLWTKTFGGTGNDYGESVKQTSDGGFIIAGETESFGAGWLDVYLIKTDSSGNTLWTKTYGGTNEDLGESIKQTSDGGFIIAGQTNSFGAGGYDVYLIRADISGDTLWTKTYGGIDDDFGRSVKQTSDGGFIIAGTTTSFGAGGYDVYLIKTDSVGNILWTKTYGGTEWDEAYSVQETQDRGFIITGYTMSFDIGSGDVYLIKTDSLGNLLWTRTYGGTEFDRGWSVQETSDRGFIIAGHTESFTEKLLSSSKPFLPPPPLVNVYVIKTDSIGDTLWTMTVGGQGLDWALSVDQTSDQGYIITGMTESSPGTLDVYLIRIGSDLVIREDIFTENKELKIIFPSFFQDEISIKFSNSFSSPVQIVLYNISGIPVFKKSLKESPISLNLKDKKIAELPSGVYFLSFFLEEYVKTAKLVKP